MAGTVERAFELARGGSCRTVSEIAQQLRRERHEMVESHLGGLGIREQLKAVMNDVAKSPGEDQFSTR